MRRSLQRDRLAESGEDVPSEDIIKGYKVDTNTYVTVDKDELDNIALESTRTIDIEEFVPKSEIDELYLVRPYYIVPEGKVGHEAYAIIRETIRTMDNRQCRRSVQRFEIRNQVGALGIVLQAGVDHRRWFCLRAPYRCYRV
jgi:Ku protein